MKHIGIFRCGLLGHCLGPASLLTLVVLALAGCSQAPPATSQATPTVYNLRVVNVSAADPDYRETQVQFETPEDAKIRVEVETSTVGGGGGKPSVTVERNSSGIFRVTLSARRNAISDDGKHSFTTLVRPESPSGSSAGGPSTYTFDADKTLDEVLTVSAVPSAVKYGVPHTIGSLYGRPIVLTVKATGE